MAAIIPIYIDQIILEIRCMIECEFCGKMAKGLADGDVDGSFTSCGSKVCGTNFRSSEDNPFFITRDNLLQVAERCAKAEQQLAQLQSLAKRCQESEADATSPRTFPQYANALTYRESMEELWRKVIDLTTPSAPTAEKSN